MQWRRRIGFGAAALALLAAIAWGFMPQPVRVEVRPAERGAMTVTVSEEGKTRVKDRFEVSAPVAGYLRRVELKPGDAVTRGQTLVELDPMRSTILDPRSRAEAQARVAVAENSLRAAEETSRAATAEAQIARLEYQRRAALCESGCVSEEERDQAEAEMRRTEAARRSAEFAIQVARFELEAAKTALAYSAAQETGAPPEHVDVHAPVDGRVLRVFHESEGVVQPGEALLEIGDPAALEIEVEVLSADAVRVHPGTRVRLERWGGEPALDGVVRVVEPTGFTKVSALGVEEQRVLVIADITSPHERWERLGDGYRVEAGFELWHAEDVLKIPNSALFRRGNEWVLFVVEDNRARLRKVDIGHRNALSAEVLAGLDEGERVIAHPSDALRDGTRVKPR